MIQSLVMTTHTAIDYSDYSFAVLR